MLDTPADQGSLRQLRSRKRVKQGDDDDGRRKLMKEVAKDLKTQRIK
jgi:hypothetical protein